MSSKISKGEQKIINLLRAGGIEFKREVSFKGLVGLKNVPLRFDFVIYKRGRIVACIDFDGAQHFSYTPFFHKNISEFRRAQEWDRRKNKFCLINKIPFIRVPYWDLEILTLERLLTDPDYLVKSKYHNDYLKKGG